MYFGDIYLDNTFLTTHVMHSINAGLLAMRADVENRVRLSSPNAIDVKCTRLRKQDGIYKASVSYVVKGEKYKKAVSIKITDN